MTTCNKTNDGFLKTFSSHSACTEVLPKYCLVVIKLFTLSSSKYQKGFQIYQVRRCHFSQYFLSHPKSAENLKAFSINFSKSEKCMSYIRFTSYVRPLKILQRTFRCLQTTHAMQPGNRRSLEIQGTAFGKSLRAWTCTYRSMPAGVAQSRHAFVGGTASTWGR